MSRTESHDRSSKYYSGNKIINIVNADAFSQPETTHSSPVFVFESPEPVCRPFLLQMSDFAYFKNYGFAVHAGSCEAFGTNISTIMVRKFSGNAKTKTFGRKLFPKPKIIKKD